MLQQTRVVLSHHALCSGFQHERNWGGQRFLSHAIFSFYLFSHKNAFWPSYFEDLADISALSSA